jgi:hypothetical protein
MQFAFDSGLVLLGNREAIEGRVSLETAANGVTRVAFEDRLTGIQGKS